LSPDPPKNPSGRAGKGSGKPGIRFRQALRVFCLPVSRGKAKVIAGPGEYAWTPTSPTTRPRRCRWRRS
jgi:hypothetical protein